MAVVSTQKKCANLVILDNPVELTQNDKRPLVEYSKIDLPGAQFDFKHHFTVVTNPLLPIQSTFAFFIWHSEGVEIDFVL